MKKTCSAEETFAVGKDIGTNALPGTVIALYGDLGAGKTVLAKGIAKGLGVTDIVSSPTFTILRVYESGRLPLFHFDVYRIGDIDEMEEVGYEDCFYGSGVSVIEWAELIEELLPKDTLRIRIETDPADPDTRRIDCMTPVTEP